MVLLDHVLRRLSNYSLRLDYLAKQDLARHLGMTSAHLDAVARVALKEWPKAEVL